MVHMHNTMIGGEASSKRQKMSDKLCLEQHCKNHLTRNIYGYTLCVYEKCECGVNERFHATLQGGDRFIRQKECQYRKLLREKNIQFDLPHKIEDNQCFLNSKCLICNIYPSHAKIINTSEPMSQSMLEFTCCKNKSWYTSTCGKHRNSRKDRLKVLLINRLPMNLSTDVHDQ